MFDSSEGIAFCMGSLLDVDRWFYYTNALRAQPTRPDQTMEILMSKLPADVMKIFSQAECLNGEECTRVCEKLFILLKPNNNQI
jgi:hypothetical protein